MPSERGVLLRQPFTVRDEFMDRMRVCRTDSAALIIVHAAAAECRLTSPAVLRVPQNGDCEAHRMIQGFNCQVSCIHLSDGRCTRRSV